MCPPGPIGFHRRLNGVGCPIIPRVEILWTAIFGLSLQLSESTRNNLELGITFIIPHAE